MCLLKYLTNKQNRIILHKSANNYIILWHKVLVFSSNQFFQEQEKSLSGITIYLFLTLLILYY